jgi:hypothetical protein
MCAAPDQPRRSRESLLLSQNLLFHHRFCTHTGAEKTKMFFTTPVLHGRENASLENTVEW